MAVGDVTINIKMRAPTKVIYTDRFEAPGAAAADVEAWALKTAAVQSGTTLRASETVLLDPAGYPAGGTDDGQTGYINVYSIADPEVTETLHIQHLRAFYANATGDGTIAIGSAGLIQWMAAYNTAHSTDWAMKPTSHFGPRP